MPFGMQLQAAVAVEVATESGSNASVAICCVPCPDEPGAFLGCVLCCRPAAHAVRRVPGSIGQRSVFVAHGSGGSLLDVANPRAPTQVARYENLPWFGRARCRGKHTAVANLEGKTVRLYALAGEATLPHAWTGPASKDTPL